MATKGSNASSTSIPRPVFKGDPAWPEGQGAMHEMWPQEVAKPSPRRSKPGYAENCEARKKQSHPKCTRSTGIRAPLKGWSKTPSGQREAHRAYLRGE